MSAADDAPDLDLIYSGDEEDLRASVRDLLADRSPWTTVLERIETDAAYDTALWKELADIGVAGLAVPEELGGSGAGLREVAVVAEELGRAVTPVPFLGSTVLATSALLAAGGGVVEQPLRSLASGASTAALAVPLAADPSAPFPDAVRASGGVLSGGVHGVADALTADVLVVPALSDSGPGLYLVEAGNVVRTPLTSLDLTRPLAVLHFDAAPAIPLCAGPEAEEALRSALLTGAAVLASEQLGIAEWALETTVAYVKTRTQFGRAVGSFQAVKHRLADLWVSVSQARAVARNAASAATDGGTEGAIAASLAQAFVSEVAVHATEEAVQLHGGIGFTWEHPAHLYLKRAKADALALGTADRHRTALASLVDLPPAAEGCEGEGRAVAVRSGCACGGGAACFGGGAGAGGVGSA